MGFIKSATKSLIDTSVEEKSEVDSDLDIIERVQEGDVAAFNQLVRKYRERLYSVVYNMTANKEDAADLAQESFIKAFQSIHKFKRKSSFYTWLYRIAVNTTITHLKKNRKRQFFSFENLQEEGASSEILERLSSKGEGKKGAFLKELQEKLNEALQTLSIKHRTVIVLHEVEGLSHQEIAEVMGCSEGTVRSRLHYAKKELQGLLKDYIK